MSMSHKNEEGRTLVEMMCILCLMGVLTTASIGFYGRAVNKMHLNDLLDEVRKRALVSDAKSSQFTYGMYNQGRNGSRGVTAYGYGVSDNKNSEWPVVRDSINLYTIAKVPVGAINGGNPITNDMCEALLAMTFDFEKEPGEPKTGAVMGLFRDPGCTRRLRHCKMENDLNGSTNVPDVVCIAIKS